MQRLSNVSKAKREKDLEDKGFRYYPRPGTSTTTIAAFRVQWEHLQPGETALGGIADNSNEATITGRITSIRESGSKLVFVDVEEGPGQRLQVVMNSKNIAVEPQASNRKTREEVRASAQRGDIISATGVPGRLERGELSLRATQKLQLLSPCLHDIPTFTDDDKAYHASDRHVQMLADQNIIRTITARSNIISGMNTFLSSQRFVNVQTPILAASAGGATARPFETSASEFHDRKLTMRIAPELWLKKLIVGGMQRVYEIGPSFRNEGLDKTHNPEFTTCEFYAVDWTLSRLQKQTQNMIFAIAKDMARSGNLDERFADSIGSIQFADTFGLDQTASQNAELGDKFPSSAGPTWSEIDFIPALNEAIGMKLPNLSLVDAHEQVLRVFFHKELEIPATPSLPRLLDKLCATYLEPRCDKATWIINIPECLSPLAKSFVHPDLPYQRVAARAELFIHHKEVVNCYEEENSPIEQRRKFIEQQRHAKLGDTVDDEAMKIDEDYIRALEWGMPPTGGWGCGIDRLCMLMLGKERISDVLSFGNLRMVARGAERWEHKAKPSQTEEAKVVDAQEDPAVEQTSEQDQKFPPMT